MLGTLERTADSLDAKRDAVVEAAAFTASLWMSYVIVFFYLLIAISSVTQRDLFMEHPVQLPFLDVTVPLQGFFFLGPAVFVIIHMYVLLHFSMLASKIGAFDNQLLESVANETLRTDIRRGLPNNVFVYFLAGPRESREGMFGFLLRLISWMSLVIGPVFLLVFFQLQFLGFHKEAITMFQRAFVVADIVLLFRLWPSALHGEISNRTFYQGQKKKTNVNEEYRRHRRNFGKSITYLSLFALSLASLFIVFAVATFPGERPLYADRGFPFINWARSEIVDGKFNPATGTLSSYWTDSIVLPNFDPIDHAQFDSEQKFDDVPSTYAIRGRNLENAVFVNDNFRKFDFTGSDLTGAVFDDAKLQRADFGCTSTLDMRPDIVLTKAGYSETVQRVAANDTPYHGASLPKQCTILNYASFVDAQLQGAVFDGAQLQGAVFKFAHLQAASLDDAQMQNSDLAYSFLQAATFVSTDLTGAVFNNADLQAVNLNNAILQQAVLDHAELQAAVILRAHLQNASFNEANLEDAILYQTNLQNASFDHTDFQGAWLYPTNLTVNSLTSANLTGVLFDNNDLIEITKARSGHFVDLPRTSEQYQEGIDQIWLGIGCDPDGAPFVLRDLIPQIKSLTAYRPEQIKMATAFYDNGCNGNRGLSNMEMAELKSLSASQ